MYVLLLPCEQDFCFYLNPVTHKELSQKACNFLLQMARPCSKTWRLCCEFSNRVYHKLYTTLFPTTDNYNFIESAQAAGFLALQPGLVALLQGIKKVLARGHQHHQEVQWWRPLQASAATRTVVSELGSFITKGMVDSLSL